MAYTTITPQQISKSGTTLTFVAPSAVGAGEGIRFLNDGSQTLLVKSTGTGATLTFVTPALSDTDLAIADRTATQPTTADREYGTWATSLYNDANGYLNVEFSAVTGITCAVRKSTAS